MIKFIPLGIPFSSSIANSASYAITSSVVSPTASIAGFAVNLVGDTGSVYVTVAADQAGPNFGLI